MVTTELGACEWFVWDLRRSNLIDRGQLDQLVSEFLQTNPRAEPPALADYLVAQGIISQFQAERLLQGKTQGFVLGPFTLMDALGAGSMGTVYKAQSKNDNNPYAVKVLPRRSMWNVRIARRKVRAFEQCRHPAVVPFVDVGTSGGMHYLAWPFVEGESFDKVVQGHGKLPYDLVARLGLQIAEGLEICHQQGLFHGLLKPSNVMLGHNEQVYILDLGIGTLLAETEGESLVDTMSTANSVASGLDCASPESIMDPTNLTPAGDQYSLGCVLYFCLSGQYPFPDGSAAEKMMAHQFKEPTPLQELCPDVPRELVDVVEQLMKKSPEQRFGSTGELVEALRGIVGDDQPQLSVAPAWAGAPNNGDAPHGSLPADELPEATGPTTPLPGSSRPARQAMPTMAAMPGVEPLRELPRTAKPSSGHLARPSLPTTVGLPRNPANLPSRQTLRKEAAPPPPPVQQPTVQQPPTPDYVPGGYEGAPTRTWEERLGPIGIALGATLAAVLAWFVASKLM